jgi:trimethylamine---corrinoid protein Co-methyltransferase
MRLEAKVFDENEVERIHHASLMVLEKIGIHMPHREALDIMESAGAKIERHSSMVKMPAQLVMDAVAKSPKSVMLYGRKPKYDMKVKEDGPFFGTMAYATHFTDFETGKRRYCTNADLAEITRLIDSLENFTWMMPIATPQDVPKETSDWYAWVTTLKNTTKHVVGGAFGANSVRDVVRMGTAIAGSEKKFRERPFASFGILTRPPLQYSWLSLDGLLEIARQKLPTYLNSGCIAGATSPVTLAGTMTLAHAEIMGGITLVQSLNPGTPMFYASWSRIMDMRTGNVSLSSPEWSIFRIGLGQLGRYLGVPIRTAAMLCDAKISDVQAGYEKGTTALAAALGGDLISGMQLDSDKLVDLADLVIDNEVAGMVRRIIRGVDVNDETIALDLISEIGPGGNYLSTLHTMRHFREEMWLPTITERKTWNVWEKAGARDAVVRAKERVREVLSTYQPDPLPADVEKELDMIAAKARLSEE